MSVRRLIIVLPMFTVLGGCNNSPPAPAMPSFDPAGSTAAAIEAFDANKDGKLDANELAKCPSLLSAVLEIDVNGDKSVDAAELTARFESFAEGAIARKMFSAQVLQGGAPVSGADVKFIPESFMLGAIEEAVGTTDSAGTLIISVPDATPPGVAVGYYRVQVSKKDPSGKETLPAKFNTETTLGIEVPAYSRLRNAGTPTIVLK